MADERMEKTIKINKLVKDIPHFDGKTSKLSNFIKRVETVIKYANPENSIYTDLFIESVKSRITDNAEEHLEATRVGDTWKEIKTSLVNRFADRRNEAYLLQQLYATYQGRDRVEIFYLKIQEIVNSLKNWADLNYLKADGTQDENEIKFAQRQYDKTALTIFVSHMKEPIGTMLRNRQSDSIQQAYNFCIEEENLRKLNAPYYYQPVHKPSIPRQNFTFQPNQYIPAPQFSNNQMQPKPALPPRPTRLPITNQNQGQLDYYNHKPFPQHRKVPSIKHEPMDTSSAPQTRNPVFKRPASIEPSRSTQRQRLYNIEGNEIDQTNYEIQIQELPYEHENVPQIIEVELDEEQDFHSDAYETQDS